MADRTADRAAAAGEAGAGDPRCFLCGAPAGSELTVIFPDGDAVHIECACAFLAARSAARPRPPAESPRGGVARCGKCR